MKRRDFIALLGGAAAWPLAAWAAEKRPRVAVLTLLSAQDERGRIAAFIIGMRELGYIAGQTVDIDYRYAEGDNERLQPLARELIALGPNVTFAGEPSAARAMKAVSASGHAAAAPPSAASNCRRPMVTVIHPSRARCVEGTIPRHERAVPNSAALGEVGAT